MQDLQVEFHIKTKSISLEWLQIALQEARDKLTGEK